MKKAIYLRMIAQTAIAVVICGLISAAIFAEHTQSETKEWLERLTLSAAQNYSVNTDASYLSKMSGGLRVTVISPTGKVLSDSEADPSEMENHAEREEIKGAKEGAVYTDIRRSDTLNENFMYASIKTQDGNIVRLAYSYAGLIPNIAAQMPAVFTAIVIALILSVFLASRFAKTVTEPLEYVVDALSIDDYNKLKKYKFRYYEVGKTLQGIQRLLERNADSRKKLLIERKRKHDFFSNASHELKTPITSILGFSEMLNQGVITDEYEKREVMFRIEKEAGRMSELINDILMISNLESNSYIPEYTWFDMSETVKEVVASVSPINEGETTAMEIDVRPITVYANERQIYELCANLIENAVKYNVPGGRVIVVLKNRGINAVLTVKDTGIGIPEKYQSRVFERFFRVDSGRDKRIGGTGLGLSIVKHIVNLYGGKISLQSKEGEGTAIEVVLPIAKV